MPSSVQINVVQLVYVTEQLTGSKYDIWQLFQGEKHKRFIQQEK